MGFKDQIAQAKELVGELSQHGLTLNEICVKLNLQFDQLYFVKDNRIYCENFFDHCPAVRIS